MAAGKPYPFKWIPVSESEKAERRKCYGHPMSSVVDVVVSEPGGIVMPTGFVKLAEQIYNMELRPDDVWIVTYPKCGTTWAQEMIWQVLHNFDVEGGKVSLEERFPFVEAPMFMLGKSEEEMQKIFEMAPQFMEVAEKFMQLGKLIETMPSPRCIKTHLPLDMLPPRLLDTCKVIMVGRNPKDCCASFMNHEQLIPFHGLTADVPSFIRFFREEKVVYGDYFYHLEQYWKNRHHPNALLIWFEDMKKDLVPVIKQVAKHLGKHLTQLKVLQLDDHLYFDNFKKNPAVNMDMITDKASGRSFINKGQVGNWKKHFTAEDSAAFDEWIKRKKQQHGIEYDGF